jgi:micrococcal nuclease
VSRIEGRVIDVIDGSTIEVACDNGVHLVRYAGIDCSWAIPSEHDLDSSRSDSLAANRELIEGKVVFLESSALESDSAGRMLCYVWAGSSLVNAELVHRGYARVSPTFSHDRYRDLLLTLEYQARDAGRGLWQMAVAQSAAAETETPALLAHAGEPALIEATPSPTERGPLRPSPTATAPGSPPPRPRGKRRPPRPPRRAHRPFHRRPHRLWRPHPPHNPRPRHLLRRTAPA